MPVSANKTLSTTARALIFLCGLLLVVVLFVPLWQIQLDAPQYPEGLILKMYPNKLSGDVEIINGLNHYIGMKTLHVDDFPEFTILPYIIIFFALFCFVTALQKRRGWLTALTICFIIFGIVAMVDFYMWEYDYGHNLDPAAAIQIPGESYQPPLLGFKQLLNFGVYSVPDIGGSIFIGVGAILLGVLIYEQKFKTRKMKTKTNSLAAVAVASFAFLLSSCSTGPQPIKLGSDACDFCRMTISDKQYGAEIMTKKGKAYKFDDTHCLFAYMKDNNVEPNTINEIYLVNFLEPHNFVEAPKGFYLKSAELHSPMGGNIATFENHNDLEKVKTEVGGEELTWEEIKNAH